MNIINAAFVRNGATVRTLPVYQFDHGMILQISGIDLPSTFRADFANTETGQSKTVIGTDGEVHIPYEYFVPGATIHCWLVWTGADYTVTRKHIMIPIARRATPTDEEPTPDEQGVIDQAIAALNDAVAQTGQDVETAAGYAEQAEQSAQAATDAQDAAVAAQNAAEAAKDQAVQSATAASASAQSASESAQSAFQSKTDAQAAAARATQSADAAQTSAGNAQASAQSAQTAAAQAAQSAEDAAAVLPQVETAGAAQVTAIQTAGQQQTQAVTTAGAQQVSAVQTEGADQRAAIETAGAAQVTAIQAEGQTQQAAIQQKGADTLASIPDDYSELAGDVADLKSAVDEVPSIKNSDAENVDLDISDNAGNVILRLADGHIRTKEFDSKNIASELNPTVKMSTEQNADLDISDADGNVLMRLQNGNIKTANFDSAIYITEKVVTVKQDGTGDYTTLRGAIDSITDASKNNPYRIEIYPGTYNVMDDYTDAEIREADVPEYHQGFVGPMLGDGVSLVGVGCRDDIIIYGTLDPDTYNSTIRGNISVLNTAGTMRLENLTVICYRLRYCVHDDFYAPNNTETYDRVVKNCRFDMQRNVETASDDRIILPNAYGAGMNGKGMNAVFEDCDFSTGLGIHTSGSNSAYPTTTIVRNCRGYAFRPNDRNETSVHFEFIVDDCDFDIIRYGHYSDDTNQVFYISGTGNGMTMLNCSATDNINIGNRTRHKNTMNLPVLTMVKRNGSSYEMTTNGSIACGIIVLIDGEYAYIQKGGYINSNILGMQNLSMGDYITVDSNGALTTSGATSSNAVGIVTNIDEYGIAYMKMLVGQEV